MKDMDIPTPAEDIKDAFRVDGMLYRLTLKAHEVIETTMKAVQSAMKHARGPDPDYVNDRDLKNLIYQAARAGAQFGGYHEAPKNGSNAWQRWMLTLCGGLALAGVIGGIAMFGQLSTIQANQANQSDKIQDLRSELSELRQSLRRP